MKIHITIKMAHQMCYHHPFSQRNRKIDRTVGVRVGGDREVKLEGGRGPNLKKKGGRQYKRVFIKYGG